MTDAQKSIVITGVSTGIGWGAAKVLTAAGYKVFGSVRKEADAKRLQSELGANYIPLIFDVLDEKAVKAAAVTVRAGLGGHKLFGLVNNAGIGIWSDALHAARTVPQTDRSQPHRRLYFHPGLRPSARRR